MSAPAASAPPAAAPAPAVADGAPAAASSSSVVLSPEHERSMQLITRNLQEVMGDKAALAKLEAIIVKRPLKLYWGTATTGAPHIAYFVPMSKIADFLRAGCDVTILFADLHAYLDNQKAPWELLKHRTDYYEAIIKNMLLAIGVSIDRLRFTRGSEYQLSREYTLDLYKLTTITTERNAKKAGAEVVKQTESPCLSGMLYPLLQALDEEYLHVDAQFGGVDQRKIFTLAEKCLPPLGYAKRVHLMNPMVPGLTGDKMSSSEKSSKIDLLDSPESIAAKLKGAFCPPQTVEGNGVLSFVKMVLFAVQKEGAPGFTVIREGKHGGPSTTYENYAALEAAYIKDEVWPQHLKDSVTAALNTLLAPIRAAFSTPEMKDLVARAYPKEVEGSASTQNEVSAVLLDDDEEAALAGKAADDVAAAMSKLSVGKSGKAKAAPAGAAAAASSSPAPPKVDANAPQDIARLDIKVGRILSCVAHPHAQKLYVSQVDCGEAAGPRQVVSGLRDFIPLEQMQERLVALLINLKPSSLQGVKSHAMILAATSEDGSQVELLAPPAGASVGERVTFAGFNTPDSAAVPELAKANENTLKKVLPELHTDASGVAHYKAVPFQTSAGPVTVATLKNALIK